MPITDKQDVKDLLTAARATRNYCMLTGRGKDKVDDLIDALEPFDGDQEKIRTVHLTELRKKMREVCREIDAYTLTRILDGDPPVRIGQIRGAPRQEDTGESSDLWIKIRIWLTRLKSKGPKLWQRLILPGLAMSLLLLSMHSTHWTLKASNLLAKLDDHLSLDFHDEIRDLIVVAMSLQDVAGLSDSTASNDPAQKLFDETMSSLRVYDRANSEMVKELQKVEFELNPIIFLGGWIPETIKRVTFTPPSSPPTPKQVLEALNAEKAGASIQEKASNLIVAEGGAQHIDDPEIMFLTNALSGHNEFNAVVKRIKEEIGSTVADYEESRLDLSSRSTDLTYRISIVNRWWLPVLYGSLGAVLFCLVRVLTPSLSDLGPGRGFLRILFGAFSAMTLSMLFIPANVFAINAQSNPTLIFLFCFLFGYSFDAVLAALHRLETYLQGQMRTDDGTPKT